MAEGPVRQQIELVRLIADHNNPRLPRVAESSRAALLRLIGQQGDKLVELAIDIAEHGLNPGESLYVTPAEDGADFIVLEGNRRFTALKLLQDSSLAEGIILSTRSLRRLREAARTANVPPTIDCVVFPDRDAAALWLKRRHTGQLEGVGLVRWGTVEQARFEFRQTGEKGPALTVLDYVIENAQLPDEIRKSAEESFSLTNLERLLDDVKAQPRLGLTVSKNKITTTLYGQRLLVVLGKLVIDIASGLKVSELDTEADRARYLDKIAQYLPKSETPRTTEGRPVGLVPADEPEPVGVPQGEQGQAPAPKGGTPAGATSSEGSTKKDGSASSGKGATGAATPRGGGGKRASNRKIGRRKGIFANDLHIDIQDRRASDLFDELRGLNPETFPNITSVGLRVFIELSAEVFIEKVPNSAPQGKKASQYHLADKLLSIITFLDSNGKLPANYAKVARAAVSDKTNPASTMAMNIDVHNVYAAPTGSEVRARWDKHEHYIRAIWAWIAEIV